MSGAAERLASRKAFQGRHVEVDVDRVRLPNGRVAELEVIRHPGADHDAKSLAALLLARPHLLAP
jgi:hypothetical protein